MVLVGPGSLGCAVSCPGAGPRPGPRRGRSPHLFVGPRFAETLQGPLVDGDRRARTVARDRGASAPPPERRARLRPPRCSEGSPRPVPAGRALWRSPTRRRVVPICALALSRAVMAVGERALVSGSGRQLRRYMCKRRRRVSQYYLHVVDLERVDVGAERLECPPFGGVLEGRDVEVAVVGLGIPHPGPAAVRRVFS